MILGVFWQHLCSEGAFSHVELSSSKNREIRVKRRKTTSLVGSVKKKLELNRISLRENPSFQKLLRRLIFSHLDFPD